jgi:hypothetical protein
MRVQLDLAAAVLAQLLGVVGDANPRAFGRTAGEP